MTATRELAPFWWLKRLAPAVVAVAVVWVGFHLWLSRHVEARLEARVESWRAEGDDVPLPEQIDATLGIPPARVDGQANAADFVYRAMMALPPLTPAQRDDWRNRVFQPTPLTPAVAPVVRSIVAQDAAALATAREAVGVAVVDWDRPAPSLGGVNWTGVRETAMHLSWSAELHHYDGDVDAAVLDGRAGLAVARTAVDYGPSIIAGLIATGCDALAATTLYKLAWHVPPRMSVEDEARAWREARPTVEAAIADLLDRDHDARLIRQSWRGERASVAQTAASPAVAAGFGMPTSGVLWSLAQSGLLPMLDAYGDMADAADVPTFAAIPAGWEAKLLESDSAAESSQKLLLSIMLPSMSRANLAFYRGIAERRAAAVILAAKLHHAETGRWPASFDDLVPSYLPRVPDDPFAPAGTPMKFAVIQGLPAVYSVGEDGRDDGGSSTSTSPRPTASASMTAPFERLDMVWPLHLPPVAGHFADTGGFNLWHWLDDPDAAVKAAEGWTDPDAESDAGP